MKITDIKENDLIVCGDNITKVNNIYKNEEEDIIFDCFIGFVRGCEVEGVLLPIDDEDSKEKEMKIFDNASSILEKKIDNFDFDKFKILNGNINCSNLNEYETLKLMNSLTSYTDKVLTNDYQVPTFYVSREGKHHQINYRIIQY